MFFFNKKKHLPPIEDWVISWFADTYRWIVFEFGISTIVQKKVLLPNEEDFPVRFENSETTAYELLPIIAKQMDLDHTKIGLHFYDNGIIEIQNDFGHKTYTQQSDQVKMYAGLYEGIDKHGKHLIHLDISRFKSPQSIIATMAHEIGHIILSEKKTIKEYDEYLVDLLTVIYGLGVFSANAAFNFFKSNEEWGYTRQGYLRQQDWAFALAIYCSIRKEENNCTWSQYLTTNISSDFRKSLEYLKGNPIKL